ncbi:MAG: glycosyltransferase [Anaerolineales bacterium]|nr:glycosyltransferase [Anaerolineales bacterium]
MDVLDATGWTTGAPRIINSIGQRLYCTSAVRRMNEILIAAAARSKPDVVWIEKGSWIYPSTLRRLRDYARFFVHYNTDDVFAPRNWFWLHRAGIRLYDLHLTTNRWNVLEIPKRYGVRVIRAGMGYDRDFHRPVSSDQQCLERSDVVFIGHWEPHTERYISALRKAGVSVRVWGYNWRKAKDPLLRAVKPLPNEDYARTISTAKIALCFLSRWNRNESTGRSFNIPAIGTFLLAERTAEHEFFYRDGQDAALFSDEKELVEKAKLYLEDGELRQSIAKNGQARRHAMGMSESDNISREWRLAVRILSSGVMSITQDDDFPFWTGFRLGLPWKKTVQGN